MPDLLSYFLPWHDGAIINGNEQDDQGQYLELLGVNERDNVNLIGRAGAKWTTATTTTTTKTTK